MNVRVLIDPTWVLPEQVLVTLSERNVRTLMKMIELQTGVQQLCRNCDGVNLMVRIEDDATHYAERESGVGPDDVA